MHDRTEACSLLVHVEAAPAPLVLARERMSPRLPGPATLITLMCAVHGACAAATVNLTVTVVDGATGHPGTAVQVHDAWVEATRPVMLLLLTSTFQRDP
jgi:hypothetical protein